MQKINNNNNKKNFGEVKERILGSCKKLLSQDTKKNFKSHFGPKYNYSLIKLHKDNFGTFYKKNFIIFWLKNLTQISKFFSHLQKNFLKA